MDLNEEQFLQDNISPELLAVPLPDDFSQTVVEQLKQESDRYWYIKPHRSLELADRIVAIGQWRDDRRQIALGLLARGNALKFLGRLMEAWTALQQSGELFRTAESEFGWARTRISRLDVALKLNHIADALVDAQRARAIFKDCGEYEMLIRLDIQEGLVYNYLGEHQRAMQLFHEGLVIADKLNDKGQMHLGPLYINIGYTYEKLGDYHQALAYYEPARELLTARRETPSTDTVKTNIAYIARIQGRYRYALKLLQEVLESVKEQSPIQAVMARGDLVECYLNLNRHDEARDLARQVSADYRTLNDVYGLARTLLHLAIAEAERANFDAAQLALAEAEQIFTALGATAWVATTWLWRGQIALKQRNMSAAYDAAVNAAARFESGGQQDKFAMATLLQGQVLLSQCELSTATEAADRALQISKARDVPSLRYMAHLLLGKIAEAQHDLRRAVRRYQAAAATIDRVQAGLTITIRSDFLQDKGEALRSLIGLFLREGQANSAFETLERAKSQAVLSYLNNRSSLHWSSDQARNQRLINDLNCLRAKHQHLYRLAHPPSTADHSYHVEPKQALAEAKAYERQMRDLIEQLYLHSEERLDARRHPPACLSDIQRAVSEDTLLVEFYSDDTHLWAFVLDGQTVTVHHLPMTAATLNQLLAQFQMNISAALNMDPHSSAARHFSHAVRRLLQKLDAGLLQPLSLSTYGRRRLIIVPYGLLHYLPFHLLHNGSSYLIERYETVILPSAGLAPRQSPQRSPGALILAHSWEGRLPHTLAEAQVVQRLFGGALYAEDATNRVLLETQPTQILHIAAHGEHRLDQPDLSYVQLGDGQLYADDLLQQDLSYELVTLSACETGRAKVVARDELIGLGRGFLYAGAGALLVSLWQAADSLTFRLMESVYRALHAGSSKAAALRQAQQFILSDDPELHPAYWGAFQLIGNAGPLSGPTE